MPGTAVRLITLIQLLQRQPNQKAAELAQELGVSVRTIHRYFEMLEEMGIPIYSERGRHGGFSLVRGYRMPPLVFTPQEAVTLVLGAALVEKMWGQSYRQAARGAQVKLQNVLPDEQLYEVDWARRTMLATGMHRTDLTDLEPHLETLRRAARERRSVHMTYQSRAQPHPTQRQLDPYALVFRWGWWYVVGYCHLRDGVRTFRLDRIQAVELSQISYQQPQEFDLKKYLSEELEAQPQIPVRLRFEAHAASAANDGRYYWDDIKEQADGSMVVSFSAPTLHWAASTALAYGPIVEVIEPAELRVLVADWSEAVARNYHPKKRSRAVN
jgi:predicted DNA-binding transcriptional regulator YafY